jgi:hypothetical protein
MSALRDRCARLRAALVTPAARRARPVMLAVLALALLAGWLRVDAQRHDYQMVDEQIPVAVIEHMRATGTPDTNWARTGVQETFRYDQYNFSSWHLAGLVATRLLPLEDPAHPQGALLRELRLVNAALGALAVLLAGAIGFRLRGGVAAVAAAALAAVWVGGVQDSLYARPEAFATVLTCALFFLATGTVNGVRVVAAGALGGLLVACKVSFVALLPFVLAALWLGAAPDRRLRVVAQFGLAAAAGFAAGAPYALLAPSEYLHGLHYLVRQYSGGHWPHGAGDGALWARLAHSGRYLLETCGWPVLLLFAVGAVACVRARDRRVLTFLAGVGATAVYFLQSAVFFERNLSHAMPFAFAIAGTGLAWLLSRGPQRPLARGVAAAAAVALVALPAAGVTQRLLRDALPGRSAAAVAAAEQELRAAGQAVMNAGYDLGQATALADRFCGRWVQRLQDFGHPGTRSQLDALVAEGRLAVVRRVPGPFHGLQVSTLQTYHGADAVFLAPPARSAAECPLHLYPLPDRAPPAATAGVELHGDAARDGHHPGALGLPAGAAAFATWAGDDANQGRITYRGPLCDHEVLPVVSGPVGTGLRLRVETTGTAAPTVLYDGEPLRGADRWVGLGVRQPGQRCVPVRVVAEDRSAAWGTWIGLGAPLTLPHLSASEDRTP